MERTSYSFKRFSIKNVTTVFSISLAYLLLSYFLIGFKQEQIVLVVIFWIPYFASPISRKFILGFSIFIVYWIVFDYMKAFPNYRFNSVHIGDLYQFEKNLFGIKFGNIILTPDEFWIQNQKPFLDGLTGFFYLCWVPVPLIFAGYLFFKNREEFLKFSLTFLWLNILGFAVYYIYPAAPPWYIQHFGNVFHAHTPGSDAGLQRFDDMFHVKIFQSLYAQSSNVFAAMPSLHSAYPIIVLYYGLKNKLGKINIVFALIMAGIWFSAVYNSHHYVVDVLAGIICAVVAIISFNWIVKNIKWVKAGLGKYKKVLE
ncbi:MAG TPA: phosphatase PAP2 family protein [Hanamia sp.]|nr:phosphatase PAP2 family protein [Hanamia sp.]